jgi:hypothetical protein
MAPQEQWLQTAIDCFEHCRFQGQVRHRLQSRLSFPEPLLHFTCSSRSPPDSLRRQLKCCAPMPAG